jgi:hypothetical protein
MVKILRRASKWLATRLWRQLERQISDGNRGRIADARWVKKDNTFSFLARRYETPVDLRDKPIQLRYDRHRSDTAAVVIYHKGQRMGAARLLDAVANGLQRRKEQP